MRGGKGARVSNDGKCFGLGEREIGIVVGHHEAPNTSESFETQIN